MSREAQYREIEAREAEQELRKLEEKYRVQQELKDAKIANTRKALAQFVAAHPEFLPSERNEETMFSAMSAPENEHLNPTRLVDWEDIYAQVREQLEQRPRRQRSAPASGLTRAEIESWSATRMEREMQNPRHVEEIDVVLSRR